MWIRESNTSFCKIENFRCREISEPGSETFSPADISWQYSLCFRQITGIYIEACLISIDQRHAMSTVVAWVLPLIKNECHCQLNHRATEIWCEPELWFLNKHNPVNLLHYWKRKSSHSWLFHFLRVIHACSIWKVFTATPLHDVVFNDKIYRYFVKFSFWWNSAKMMTIKKIEKNIVMSNAYFRRVLLFSILNNGADFCMMLTMPIVSRTLIQNDWGREKWLPLCWHFQIHFHWHIYASLGLNVLTNYGP